MRYFTVFVFVLFFVTVSRLYADTICLEDDPSNFDTYTIKNYASLSYMSKTYNIDYEYLRKLNPDLPEKLHKGDVVRFPKGWLSIYTSADVSNESYKKRNISSVNNTGINLEKLDYIPAKIDGETKAIFVNDDYLIIKHNKPAENCEKQVKIEDYYYCITYKN